MENKNFEGINLYKLKMLIDERGSLETFIKHCEDERDVYWAIIKKHANDRSDNSLKVTDAAKAFYDSYDTLYHAAKMIEEDVKKTDSLSLTEKLDECLDYITGELLNLEGDDKKLAKGVIGTVILPFVKNEDDSRFAVKLEITNGGK